MASSFKFADKATQEMVTFADNCLKQKAC